MVKARLAAAAHMVDCPRPHAYGTAVRVSRLDAAGSPSGPSTVVEAVVVMHLDDRPVASLDDVVFRSAPPVR